jgi:hypothetical protein
MKPLDRPVPIDPEIFRWHLQNMIYDNVGRGQGPVFTLRVSDQGAAAAPAKGQGKRWRWVRGASAARIAELGIRFEHVATIRRDEGKGKDTGAGVGAMDELNSPEGAGAIAQAMLDEPELNSPEHIAALVQAMQDEPGVTYTGTANPFDLHGGGGGGKGQSKGKDIGAGVGMEVETVGGGGTNPGGDGGPVWTLCPGTQSPSGAAGDDDGLEYNISAVESWGMTPFLSTYEHAVSGGILADDAEDEESAGSEESDGGDWIRIESADAVLSPFGQDKYIRIFTTPSSGLAIMCNDAVVFGHLIFYDFEMPTWGSDGNVVYTLAEHEFWLYRAGSSDHDEAIRSFPTEEAAISYMHTHDPDADATAWSTMPDFVEMYMEANEAALANIWDVPLPPSSPADEEGGEEGGEEEVQSQPDQVVDLQPEPTTGWRELVMSEEGTVPHIICRKKAVEPVGPPEHHLLMYLLPPATSYFGWHRRTGQVFQVFPGNRWERMDRINFRIRLQPNNPQRAEIQMVTREWAWENQNNAVFIREYFSTHWAAYYAEALDEVEPRDEQAFDEEALRRAELGAQAPHLLPPYVGDNDPDMLREHNNNNWVELREFNNEACPGCMELFEPNVDRVMMRACGHCAHPGCEARWGQLACMSCRQPSRPELQTYRPTARPAWTAVISSQSSSTASLA